MHDESGGGDLVRPTLFLLGFLASFVGGAAASAQTGDVDDFRTLTVLQVDPAANEIRVRETGTLRIRTLQLDENSVITGGSGIGGSMTLDEIQAGDKIRVRDAAGSASDRVHAEQIQVLATPPDRPAPGGMRVDPSDRPVRSPSALDPPEGEPGALGTQRPGDPSALFPDQRVRDRRNEPGTGRDRGAGGSTTGSGTGSSSGTGGSGGGGTGGSGGSSGGGGP
jgi:hypothetical protein